MSLGRHELLSEFWHTGVSKVGIAFLIVLLGVSVYTLTSFPLNFGITTWNNPAVWADYPKAAPPAWTNLFTDVKKVEHKVFVSDQFVISRTGEGLRRLSFTFPVQYNFDEFPQFTSLTVFGVIYHERPPLISVQVIRPDNGQVGLFEFSVSGPRPGEKAPYVRYTDTGERVVLSTEGTVARQLANFVRDRWQLATVSPRDVTLVGADRIIYGLLNPGTSLSVDNLKVFDGTYIYSIHAQTFDERDRVGRVQLVIGGSIFGLMGTDTIGRDLAIGLLFGFPVALFIGFVTSVATTIIGASAGVVSGYVGGRVDSTIQRAADLVANVPLLPLLIFLIFVFRPSVWNIVLVLIAFTWPGLTIIVRSMVLQIRGNQFIEAAVALGASTPRIMFRHIFPQVAPFVFAQLIFFTPTAILAEAGLSFLGLGDPSMPTWGQILEVGFRNGAIFLGHWWWVVPPGVLIVITAITFVLIALGLEPVVNPKLRRRR